jgi:hypothetical protein
MPNSINPQHETARTLLRIVGPLLLLAGGACVVIATIDFFSIMGKPYAQPTKFYLFFIGLPVGFLGLVLTQFGFLGAVFRYQAGEVAPVGKDTFNYLARGTRSGVRDIASAVGEGLRDDGAAGQRVCSECGAANDADARFCDACGAALTT